MANHEKGSHKHVHNTGNHGGFAGTKEGGNGLGDHDGPGYPMSEHGAQKAHNGGRQGGRQSGSTHAAHGREDTLMTDKEE